MVEAGAVPVSRVVSPSAPVSGGSKLGALGLASMWTAIFADVGVMVLAVLNATRALYTKDLAKKNVQ